MALADIIGGLKKKLSDSLGYGVNAYNTVADALPLVPNTSQIKSFAAAPVQYVSNPKYNAGNNLYSTSPFKTGSTVQNFIESPTSVATKIPSIPLGPNAGLPARAINFVANIPIEITKSVVGKGILDPALDAGANIGRALRGSDVAPYSQVKSPITRLGYQISSGAGIQAPSDTATSLKHIVGNIAGVASPLLDAHTGGTAKAVAGKVTLSPRTLRLITSTVKDSSKLGGVSGLATGLNDSKDLEGGEYIKSVLGSLATGAIAGGVLGAGAAGMGALKSKLTKEVLATTKGIGQKEAEKIVEKFARNELGRFASNKKVNWVRDSQISDAQIKALRSSLGLPLDGNYNTGAVDMSAEVKLPKHLQDLVKRSEGMSMTRPAVQPKIDRKKLTGLQLSATNETLSKDRVLGSLPQTQSEATTVQSADSFLDSMDALAATRASQPVAPSKSSIAQTERAMIQAEIKRPYIDPKLSKGMKDYTSQDIPSIAGKALNKASTDPKEFDSLFSKWIGKRDSAKTKATEYVLPITKIKKEIAWDVIRSIEEPGYKTTPEVKKHADTLKKMFKDVRQHALDSGINLGEIDNYFTHIWNESPEQVQQMLGASQKFKYALERKIPTYQEGIELGLTPKYNNPAEIMEVYVKKLEQTKANIEFFEELQKRGIVVDAAVGTRTPGFEPISADGFPKSRSTLDGVMNEGQYYAPKNVAATINRVFNPQEVNPTLEKIAKVSSTMQDILMSGGLPKTPANAWTYAQINKEFLSGRITKPVAAFLRSFSAEKSNEFFTKNAQQIIKLQERNVPVNSTFNASSMVDKNAVESILGSGAGEIWKKVTSEPTFKRFMPQLQISLFNDIEQKLIRQGRSAGEAADLAAKVVKNFYGTKTTDVAAKSNPTTEAIKTSLFFAPSYRETMITFWKNTLKSLKDPRSVENQMNARFAVGATLAMATADQINRALNDGQSILNNPKGDEDKVLVPIGKITGNPTDKTVIKFNPLFSLNFIPRTALKIAKNIGQADFPQVLREAKGFLSTPLRPIADVATNQDYFHNNIYGENNTPGEKYKEIGSYLGDQYVLQHPYLKVARKYLSQTDKKPYPIHQALTEAGELPIRYTTTDKLKTQRYFGEKEQIISALNGEERKAFESLPKSDGASQDEREKNTRLKYNIFLKYPAVYEAAKKAATSAAKVYQNELDPLYKLSGENARTFIAYTAASPGSVTRREILKESPWVSEVRKARNDHFLNRDIKKIEGELSEGKISREEAEKKKTEIVSKAASFSQNKPSKISLKRAKNLKFRSKKVSIKRPKTSIPKMKITKVKKIKIKARV